MGAQGTHQEIHSTWGGVGGIKAGYNFNSIPVCNFMNLRLQPAVEAEALYIGDSSHVRNFADGGAVGGGGGGGANNAVRPAIVANPGDPGSNEDFTTNSGDFFINSILRFKNSSMVTPYIGIGAGLQYLTTHGEITVPRFGLEATGRIQTTSTLPRRRWSASTCRCASISPFSPNINSLMQSAQMANRGMCQLPRHLSFQAGPDRAEPDHGRC